MKKLIALLLVLAMAFSLAACGTQSDEENQQPNDSQQAQQPDSGDNTQQPEDEQTPDPSQDAEPELNNEVVEYYLQKANEVQVTDTHVIFTDDGSGQELTIEKNPKKVAVLYGSLVSLWYEAGGTAQFAIGGKSAIQTYQEQIGRDITQDEGVLVVAESSSGTNWDVEQIIGNSPDLIICSTGMSGYSTISDPADAVGIPVIGINYSAVQDYLKWFKVFCNLTDNGNLWDEVAEKTANEIIDIVSAVPQDVEAPKVAILQLSSKLELGANSAASLSGTIVKELGGYNVADPENAGSGVDISMEDLYAMDPDMIFVVEFGETSLSTLLDIYGEDPVWQALRAVQEGRVYNLEKGLFLNKANKRYNESYRIMAQYLYPDAGF